jgi:hypothetical protein
MPTLSIRRIVMAPRIGQLLSTPLGTYPCLSPQRQQVVVARRGDFEGAACRGLTTHVGKVVKQGVALGLLGGLRERQLALAPQSLHELGQRCHRAHLQALDQSRFGRVRARHDRAPHLARTCAEQLRENASQRLDGTLER